MLESVGRSLVAIFGQHEHQTLLDADEHVQVLDRFGNLEPKRKKTARTYDDWRNSVRGLSRAEQQLKEMQALTVSGPEPSKNFDPQHSRRAKKNSSVIEKDLLKRAVQIRDKAYDAYQILYSRSGSIMEELAEVKRGVTWLAAANPALNALREDFEGAVYTIEDVAFQLREVAEKSA